MNIPNNITKAELEKIKLLKEIETLNQPFIFKQFGSVVALIIGVLSVSIGIYTGLFNEKNHTPSHTILVCNR